MLYVQHVGPLGDVEELLWQWIQYVNTNLRFYLNFDADNIDLHMSTSLAFNESYKG